MSNLDDIKSTLRALPTLIEAVEAAQKITNLGGENAAKALATANAILRVGLDAMNRTISVGDARLQIQRLSAREPQKSADAVGRAEVDKLFGDNPGDDDTVTGGGEEDG